MHPWMTAMAWFALLAGQVAASTPPSSQRAGGTLVVEVRGFRSKSGGAALSIYGDKAGFPATPDKALQAAYKRIGPEKVLRWELKNLRYGEYAVALFHDENGNQQLETNVLGIPKEGLGISNNVTPRFGPPTFKDAKFQFTQDKQTIVIDLQY